MLNYDKYIELIIRKKTANIALENSGLGSLLRSVRFAHSTTQATQAAVSNAFPLRGMTWNQNIKSMDNQEVQQNNENQMLVKRID